LSLFFFFILHQTQSSQIDLWSFGKVAYQALIVTWQNLCSIQKMNPAPHQKVGNSLQDLCHNRWAVQEPLCKEQASAIGL